MSGYAEFPTAEIAPQTYGRGFTALFARHLQHTRTSGSKKVQSRYFYRHQNNYSLHQGAMCSSHIYHPVYLIFFCFRHGKNITIHLWKIYCVQIFYHFPTATKLLYPPSYFLLLEETKLLPTTERSYLITTLTFYHISLW